MTLPKLKTIPIDDGARTGRYQLVFGGDADFACVRWDGESWVYSSGRPLDFAPEAYVPMGGFSA